LASPPPRISSRPGTPVFDFIWSAAIKRSNPAGLGRREAIAEEANGAAPVAALAEVTGGQNFGGIKQRPGVRATKQMQRS
jgi:hypothetical protein